jgi:hypothetical protein
MDLTWYRHFQRNGGLNQILRRQDSGQLSTKIYDKRDDFNFKIINFPNMCSNIPACPSKGDKYVIDEELQHTDHLFLGVACFTEFLPLIYPPELEVKETTDAASSASFLDLYLAFEDSGQLSTKGKVKTHNYINRQNQSTTEKL